MKKKIMELGFQLLTEEIVPVWEKTEDGTKVVVGKEFYEALKLKTPYHTWTSQIALTKRIEGVDYWTFKEGRNKTRLFTINMAIDLAHKSRTQESSLVALWLEEVKKGNLELRTPEMVSDLLKKSEKESVKEKEEEKASTKELKGKDSSLTIFNFKNKNVRTLLIDGDPWFVGKDVAQILGYSNTKDALKKRIDDEDKARSQIATQFGIKDTTIINESGLYSLIISSKLPTAKQFKRWVTSEVLPSIRKTGQYQVIQKLDSYLIENPAERARRWAEEYEEKELLENKLKEAQPKIEFADAIEESEGSVSIGFLAKEINKRVLPMGRTRLFKWMRENGYLIKQEGEDYNTPTQRSVNAKLFEVIPHCIEKENGETLLKKTVRVTGKGQQYFINKFLEIKKKQEEQAN